MESTRPPLIQTAPFPEKLESLIKRLEYKSGWEFHLEDIDRGQGSEGLTLNILINCTDSYNPDRQRRVAHYFIVPAAAYDERAWMRWLLDQCLLVETHECLEFFRIDGKRPYAPNHGPGRNPYSIIEKGTYKDAATHYTGEQFKPERAD